jgi:serine phosphatase RsbU (regulator of sigma subunit)
MTYRTARGTIETGTMMAAALAFLVVPFVAAAGLPFLAAAAVGAAAFTALYALDAAISAALSRRAYSRSFRGLETGILTEFTERVGVCFTVPDLVEAIRGTLERTADMGVVLVKAESWEPVYQSPATASSDPRLVETLELRFRGESEAIGFLAEDLSPSSRRAAARGFYLRAGGYRLFALTRLCALIEPEAFRILQGELAIYFERVSTIARLFEVASLSKEWRLIAETQRSFLPRSLPARKKLDLAAYYRPLVNVSGDYYDAIAIDEDRTLLVVGDVSGKGLAAALIMGIIVNTIRIAADKSDLAALVRGVDAAVREMGFDDKYTVMFMAVVDTAKRTLRYVSAAMPYPILITQAATGPRLVRLEPTMGLVGLLPLEGIVIEELPLRTDEIILLASDGVSEATDASGARLGEAELFDRTLAAASKSKASDFVAELSAMLYSYAGDSPLRDDVTILAAKVGRLWD